jgi:hypothetical protein
MPLLLVRQIERFNVEYMLTHNEGEFNSVSCGGRANVSNTFGQALWLVCG